jgi:hypothetical protein
MRQLSEIMGIVKCVLAVQARVLVLHNDESGIDRQLMLVCILHHQCAGGQFQIGNGKVNNRGR